MLYEKVEMHVKGDCPDIAQIKASFKAVVDRGLNVSIS
jgi:hypothetical protein